MTKPQTALWHSPDVISKARSKPAAVWEAMERGAALKADEAGRSDAPWALGNLRLYQDLENRFGTYAAIARRLEECSA
jgi:hypothetical protein